MNILQEVQAEKKALIGLRRTFHQHPEPSRAEHQTAAKIKAELASAGVPSESVGETGVYAVIRGEGEGKKTIVLRADIDALPVADQKKVSYRSQTPGVMHACGHDLQTTALLGAAQILQRNRGAFGGEIRLFFQQAEEIGYGARIFLKEGRLEGADRVFGIHAASDLQVGKVGVKSGTNNASVDHFLIEIEGKAAHVSTPQCGVDALYIGAQIVSLFQGVVTRQTSPTDTTVIGVGTLHAGSAYNVIAETAVLEGTTRTVSPELRAFAKQQVEEIALQTARLYGGRARVTWTDYASPLINDGASCAEVAATIRDLWGEAAVVTDRTLSLGGDDFAEFLNLVPGVYAYVGTGNLAKPNTLEPHHSSLFDLDEDAIPVATALYAQYAYRFLTGNSERI